MAADLPNSLVPLSVDELAWLVGATEPAPLVACTPDVGTESEVVVAALIARGILHLTETGALRPAGREAAVLGVALAADEAFVLTSFAPDAVIDFALYVDGDRYVAHQHDDTMHGFAAVEYDWAVRAVAEITGIDDAPSVRAAPVTGPVMISPEAWGAVQRAAGRDAAMAVLPEPAGLAQVAFDATRVHAVDRMNRNGDGATKALRTTLYEGPWGPDLWVVDGAADATELRVRSMSRVEANVLLIELLP
jgi:hypothetical protein